MGTSDWINIGLAIITLIGVGVALSLGLLSLWQVRNTQTKEYKNALLNNIVNWAMEIQKTSRYRIMTDALTLEEEKTDDYIRLYTDEIRRNFIGLLATSPYVSKISEIFDKKLQKSIEELISGLNDYINLLEKCRDQENGDKLYSSMLQMKEPRSNLDNLAGKVLTETARIKIEILNI